jgi:hypothetical protein
MMHRNKSVLEYIIRAGTTASLKSLLAQSSAWMHDKEGTNNSLDCHFCRQPTPPRHHNAQRRHALIGKIDSMLLTMYKASIQTAYDLHDLHPFSTPLSLVLANHFRVSSSDEAAANQSPKSLDLRWRGCWSPSLRLPLRRQEGGGFRSSIL